jgi:predicted DNA-binding protein (UPF0251 family)
LTSTTKNRKGFEEYISQAAAARTIGTTRQTVANLIREGYLRTKTVAERSLVLRSDAENYERRPKGRPPKSKQDLPTKKPNKNLTSPINAEEAFEDYISQAEAARRLGVSDQAVWKMIQEGILTGKPIADRVAVLGIEVEAYRQKREARLAQKKAKKKTTTR